MPRLVPHPLQKKSHLHLNKIKLMRLLSVLGPVKRNKGRIVWKREKKMWGEKKGQTEDLGRGRYVPVSPWYIKC
jgi:hypothetical protein